MPGASGSSTYATTPAGSGRLQQPAQDGPHDLRHTFATWPEDAGIPARVIDELMGHQATGRGQQRGSAMGAHYRHITPEMAARAVDAIQLRHVVGSGVAVAYCGRPVGR